jgi:hypothetical protein
VALVAVEHRPWSWAGKLLLALPRVGRSTRPVLADAWSRRPANGNVLIERHDCRSVILGSEPGRLAFGVAVFAATSVSSSTAPWPLATVLVVLLLVIAVLVIYIVRTTGKTEGLRDLAELVRALRGK